MQKLLRLFNASEINQIFVNPNVYKYGIVILLLIIPLYPKFPVFNISGTYVSVRIEDFLVGLLAIIWFLGRFMKGFVKFFKDKINQAILIFFLAGLLSVISSIIITHSASLSIAIFHWIRRIEYLVPFFIARDVVKDNKGKIHLFAEAIFVVSFFTFLYGLGQIYAGFPVISTQNQEYSKGIALRWIPGTKLSSTFAGHYDLAAFLVFVLSIASGFIFTYRKASNQIFFFLLVIAPSFWLLLQTQSRISFVSYLVGITLTLWFLKKKYLIIPAVGMSLILALLFSGLGLRYRNTINSYFHKITSYRIVTIVYAQTEEEIKRQNSVINVPRESSPEPEDRSAAIRLNIEWPRAIRAFSKNPLLGTGYSSITLATDNDYLRSLGEVGLVGTLAFFLVIFRIASKFIYILKDIGENITSERAFTIGFFGAFIGLLINASFIDVFEASKIAIIFWTLAGLAVGLAEKTNVKN